MIKIEDGDFCKGCKLVGMYNELEENNSLLFDNDLKTIEKMSKIIRELQEENKKLHDGWQQEIYDKNKINNLWFRTQGRIDKAIEYINNACYSLEFNKSYLDNLLEILKGE